MNRYGNSEGYVWVFYFYRNLPFVNSPFIKYNKSKDVCESHAKSRLHLLANDKAYSTYSNPDWRIDSLTQDVQVQFLPLIVKAVSNQVHDKE